MADFASALSDRLKADAGVSAIAGPRGYWVKVPQGTPLPYYRMQVISDPRPEHLKGYDGARRTRVQVDCFAQTYAASRALAEAVVTATITPGLYGGTRFGRVKAEGPRDLGEDVTGGSFIHRASVDLLVEHRPA